MRERISNKMMEKENFNVVDIFGENVFNDSVMQARLPKKVYKKLHEVMEEGKELDLETADVVAHEMKEWAIEKGATHYTHWFQPLTGVTAEKHDSFITAPMENGKVLMSFSGKELKRLFLGCIRIKLGRTVICKSGITTGKIRTHIIGINLIFSGCIRGIICRLRKLPNWRQLVPVHSKLKEMKRPGGAPGGV